MTTDPLAALLHVHHIGCLEAINGQKPLTGDDQRTHEADAARLRAAGVHATCGAMLGKGPATCVLPSGHDGYHEWSAAIAAAYAGEAE